MDKFLIVVKAIISKILSAWLVLCHGFLAILICLLIATVIIGALKADIIKVEFMGYNTKDCLLSQGPTGTSPYNFNPFDKCFSNKGLQILIPIGTVIFNLLIYIALFSLAYWLPNRIMNKVSDRSVSEHNTKKNQPYSYSWQKLQVLAAISIISITTITLVTLIIYLYNGKGEETKIISILLWVLGFGLMTTASIIIGPKAAGKLAKIISSPSE